MKFPICCLEAVFLCLLGSFLPSLLAQRVALRNPGGLEPGSVPTYDSQSKVHAKPGDVLVHFDRKNEIQQIQYVLRDGRLATLFQRKPTDFYGKAVEPLPNPISFVHRRSEQSVAIEPPEAASAASKTPASSTPLGLPTSDIASQPHESPKTPSSQAGGDSSGPSIVGIGMNDPVFGVLNTKLASLPHLSDKTVTVVVPDRKIFPMNIDLSQFPVAGMPLSDKMDILATVASDAAQVTAPLRKAMMDKLRNKVSQKIRELPGIIENKLRAKSSMGHLILEKATSRYVPIVEGKINQPLPPISSSMGSKFIMIPQPLVQQVAVELPMVGGGKTVNELQYPGFVQPNPHQQTKPSNQVLQDSATNSASK